MPLRFALLLCMAVSCESVFVYSSFWAPLFNPRILNYRVDSAFEPTAGESYREQYERRYGVRGEKLIEDLGNGKGPAGDVPLNTDIAPVKFYYTYPGAEKDHTIAYNSI